MAGILKQKDEDAAQALGISKSAYKVRLSRARKKVTDYLAPRCEHVDPLNPCRCPARVGVALRKGFIRSSGEVKLRQPVTPFGRYGAGPDTEDKPLRDVMTIYSHLPEPDPPETLATQLIDALNAGTWDEVRDRSKQSSAD
jgi:RNA polymerase sigma-70 factor (ECF subfamily)